MAWLGLHSPHLQYRQVVCFCEKWNELSRFIECNKFYDQLKKYYLVTNSAPWSRYLVKYESSRPYVVLVLLPQSVYTRLEQKVPVKKKR
jgi:hypothetical protein